MSEQGHIPSWLRWLLRIAVAVPFVVLGLMALLSGELGESRRSGVGWHEASAGLSGARARWLGAGLILVGLGGWLVTGVWPMKRRTLGTLVFIGAGFACALASHFLR